MPVYRTKKTFAVVHFEETGKGRIVFLPQGAEVRVIGPSSIGKCFEVMFENKLYNIFKVDLLGPWATLAAPIPVKDFKLKPMRVSAAVAVSA